MISIVVCSVKEDLYKQFADKIKETIGTPYEIIRVDNTGNQYSICSAYNKGASESQFEIVCLCHEDILFRTNNWGNILTELFKNPEIGAAGVVGACYLSLFPTTWINQQEYEGQVILDKNASKPETYHNKKSAEPVPVFR
jgi:Glycosyltransferase like family